MKKNVFLWGALIAVGTSFFIYSCSKQTANTPGQAAQSTTDPVKLVSAATNWYTNQNQASSGSVLSNNKPASVLPPDWKNAKTYSLSNGKTDIVVPGPDFKLNPNSTLGFLRKLVFTQEGGIITGGRIIEVYAAADYLSANKNDLIENYLDGKMGNFSGSIISYDATYRYFLSEVFKNGVRQDAHAIMRKGNPPQNASNIQGPIVESTTSCYNYWDVTTYSDGSTTWQYLFTLCDPSAPANNSEAGGGGGSSASGPPPVDCTTNQFAASSSASALTSGNTTPYTPGTPTKTNTYSWIFCQSSFGAWSSVSTENATEYWNGTAWAWASLTHGSAATSGFVGPGSISVSVQKATPTIGLYVSSMTLYFTFSGSYTCQGSQVTTGTQEFYSTISITAK